MSQADLRYAARYLDLRLGEIWMIDPEFAADAELRRPMSPHLQTLVALLLNGHSCHINMYEWRRAIDVKHGKTQGGVQELLSDGLVAKFLRARWSAGALKGVVVRAHQFVGEQEASMLIAGDSIEDAWMRACDWAWANLRQHKESQA